MREVIKPIKTILVRIWRFGRRSSLKGSVPVVKLPGVLAEIRNSLTVWSISWYNLTLHNDTPRLYLPWIVVDTEGLHYRTPSSNLDRPALSLNKYQERPRYGLVLSGYGQVLICLSPRPGHQIDLQVESKLGSSVPILSGLLHCSNSLVFKFQKLNPK